MTQFAETMAGQFAERRIQLLGELEAVEAVLNILNGSAPTAETKSSNGSKSRGRPVGTGHRDKQVLAILSDRGPLTMAQIAEQIGMPPNYLYRVGKRLEERGLAKHDKGTWSIA